MQTLARMEVSWQRVNKQETQCSDSHHASLTLISDTGRWRLAEHSLWSWMCVVCWAERKVALRPSLIQTCYVCSLLWSNCTLGSRYTSCKCDKMCHLAVLIRPWNIFKSGPYIYIIWCVNNSQFWTWTCRPPQLAASQARVKSFYLIGSTSLVQGKISEQDLNKDFTLDQKGLSSYPFCNVSRHLT